MTSPKRDGRPVKQPRTQNTHTPKGGYTGKVALKLRRQRHGVAKKMGYTSSPSAAKGGTRMSYPSGSMHGKK